MKKIILFLLIAGFKAKVFSQASGGGTKKNYKPL